MIATTKTKRKARLRGLTVHEISLVTSGANDAARVVIAKAAEPRGGERLVEKARTIASATARWEPCADCPDKATCRGRRKCGIETPAKGARPAAVAKAGGARLVDAAHRRAAELRQGDAR